MGTNRFGDPEVTAAVNRFGDPVYVPVEQNKLRLNQHEAYMPAPDQTLRRAAGAAWEQLNPLNALTNIGTALLNPIDTGRALIAANADQIGKARDMWSRGRYTEAFGHGLAGALPLIGPAAAAVGEQLGGADPVLDKYGNVIEPGRAPDPMGALGAGTGLLASILLAPAAARQTGRVLKATGRGFTRSALGLHGKAESFGAHPAEAVLRDTRGLRPGTIARTGQERLVQFGRDLDAAVNAPNAGRPSLEPARQVLRDRIDAARRANASSAELEPMLDQLTVPGPGFGGTVRITPSTGAKTIAPTQPASQFLEMQRGFSTDNIGNWNPLSSTKGKLGAARKVYHAMREELSNTVPGAAELNERMHSLIPAVERAKAVSGHAGPLEHALARFHKPTGALLAPIFGLHEGGAGGFVAGLGIPEAVASPALKMGIARGAYGTGGLLSAGATQRAAQLLPILGLLSDEYSGGLGQ